MNTEFETLIGDTPVRSVEVNFKTRVDFNRHFLHLKLEGYNPGGSVKDRTAVALVRDSEERGCLKAGGIIVVYPPIQVSGR